MKRVGRHGRFLGTTGPVLSEEEEKIKGIFEAAGINYEIVKNMSKEERDGTMKALMESSVCDRDREELSTSQFHKETLITKPSDTQNDVLLEANGESETVTQKNDISEDDEATQEPDVWTDLPTFRSGVSTGFDQVQDRSSPDGGGKSEVHPSFPVQNSQEDEETQHYDISNQKAMASDTERSPQPENMPSLFDAIPETQSEDSCQSSRTVTSSTCQPHLEHLVTDDIGTGKETIKSESESVSLEKDGKLHTHLKNSSYLKYAKQPNFYAPDSLNNPELYTPVIKLMFDIYIQRLRRVRERKKYSTHRASWGKPVAAGFHAPGYMRAARSSKYRDLENDLMSTRMRCLRSRRGQDSKIDNSGKSSDSDLDDFMVTVGDAEGFTKKSGTFNKEDRMRRQIMATDHASSGDDCKKDAIIEATVQQRSYMKRKSTKRQAASDSDSASNLVVSEEEPEWLPGKKNISKKTKANQSAKKGSGRLSSKKCQKKNKDTNNILKCGVKRMQTMAWDEKQKDEIAENEVGCSDTDQKNKTSDNESCKETDSPECVDLLQSLDQNEVHSKKFSWCSPEKTGRSFEDNELEISIKNDQNICGKALETESNFGVSSSATYGDKINKEIKCDDTQYNTSARTVKLRHVNEVSHEFHSTEDSDHKSNDSDMNIQTQYSEIANDKITSSQDCLSVTSCSPVSLLNTNGDMYCTQIPGKILEKRQDPAKIPLKSLKKGKNKFMGVEESVTCNAKVDEKEKDATVSSSERTPGLSLEKKNAWLFAAKSEAKIESSVTEIRDKINCCDREKETGKRKLRGKLKPTSSNEEAREKKIECSIVDGVELLETVGKSDKRKRLLTSESVLTSFDFHEKEDTITLKEKRRKVDPGSVDGLWTDVETGGSMRRERKGRAVKNTSREKEIVMHAGTVPITCTMSDNGSDIDNIGAYGIHNRTRQGTIRMTSDKETAPTVGRNFEQFSDTKNVGLCPICEKAFPYDVLVVHACTCGEDEENA